MVHVQPIHMVSNFPVAYNLVEDNCGLAVKQKGVCLSGLGSPMQNLLHAGDTSMRYVVLESV